MQKGRADRAEGIIGRFDCRGGEPKVLFPIVALISGGCCGHPSQGDAKHRPETHRLRDAPREEVRRGCRYDSNQENADLVGIARICAAAHYGRSTGK